MDRRVTALCTVVLIGTALLGACQEPELGTGGLQVQVGVNAAARVVEDTDGFYLAIDQHAPQHIAVVDSVLFAAVPVGEHRLDLTDVRSTCAVGPSNPLYVTVKRDTVVRTFFSGSCQ
jgi:hypothetical protein